MPHASESFFVDSKVQNNSLRQILDNWEDLIGKHDQYAEVGYLPFYLCGGLRKGRMLPGQGEIKILFL
jgi:hypothetical protein